MQKTFNAIENTKAHGMAQRLLSSVSWLGCLTAIFLLMCAGTAMAQLSGKGAVTGTVTDKMGAVVPGAEVTATNGATNISTTAKTTGSGAYNFTNLDPGIYTVTVTAQGFAKQAQENIHVNAMESQAYNPVLTVSSTNEVITVTAEPPALETSNATLGATMEQETYAELPIEMGAYGSPDQRRATDFAYLMPGVQGNMTNGNATTNTGVVNGSGSRGAVSNVYIDGIPFVRAGGNGDPRYVWSAISVDAVDQFQVQTTGSPAIYEGQGVMNYSVKHGGTQFHGSVYEFFRNTALDTWGWFGKIPNAATGVPVKPIEHSNEYGIAIGGPLVPFGSLKEKLFFFTNYNGFRYSSATPTPMRFPSNAERNGDFSADGVNIYDPSTEATCASFNGGKPCRYQYGYGPSGTSGTAGNPVQIGTPNVIPSSQFAATALKMQSFLPSITNTSTGNNYVAANQTGLTNWSTTSRIDYNISSKDTLSVLGAVGRQASSVPVGQTTAGRNTAMLPYNYGQAYAPKTAVWTVEETHVFSSNLLNQLKWGYARYNGPTFNPNDNPKYAATAMGISGLPQGQAMNMFPIVCFSPNGSACSATNLSNPTQWNGATETTTVAANYTAVDNLQWNVGKHSFTFGGQVAWLLYNVVNATGGSTPITLTTAPTETAQLNNAFVTVANTGLPYAGFLIGQMDKGTFTQYLQNEFGARFRAISPYVQDDWKMTNKLTLNLGLRYDFYPTLTEVHNAGSFFNPTLANPVTGLNGALQFTGTGAGTCNCSTPANNYFKNFGPRLGLAYQLDSKTVIRASYGVMYSHGNAVGGLNTSLGTLGFSAAPTFSSSGSLVTTMPGFLAGGSGSIPTFTGPTGVASGPAFGSGYTKTSGYTGTPSSGMNYNDPYLGGRAPEFINWSFGIQRQIASKMTLTASYVGSEGHFLQLDSNNARGYWANALDPKYLGLGVRLADTGTTGTTVTQDCATYNLTCAGLSNFTTSQPLSTLLKPFPFQSVSDGFGYVGNANYHGLQAVLSTRAWRGLTVNANYTWSRAIDDGGTFRTGYPIPAGTLANHPTLSYKADRIERSVSTSNQPQHFVATAVWDWPFGKSVLAQNPIERAIMGGFKFSGVYQAYSGSPLAITGSTCQTNPAVSTCAPTLNPNFTGSARQNGKWGHGVTWANYNATSSNQPTSSSTFIVPSVGSTTTPASGPFISPVAPSGQKSLLASGGSYDYTFGDAPRTAPYNINGPGNYQLDLAMVRSFPLHITEASKLDFRAEWYNVTNHTLFAVASTAVGNANFGQVTQSGNLNRKSAQFSARISF
ncbi:MAG TPA: carboxypeptidase regulatory-like domain-containing protein [Terracidiphilus sp.]|nr:carboxypeptidase regulatory-like domain-containing protein [Terracidiphilus sp.]